MNIYQYTFEELEDVADTLKIAVVQALVNDGLIDEQKADDRAALHTIKFSNKSIWRTITNCWKQETETTKFFVNVVGKHAAK